MVISLSDLGFEAEEDERMRLLNRIDEDGPSCPNLHTCFSKTLQFFIPERHL